MDGGWWMKFWAWEGGVDFGVVWCGVVWCSVVWFGLVD